MKPPRDVVTVGERRPECEPMWPEGSGLGFATTLLLLSSAANAMDFKPRPTSEGMLIQAEGEILPGDSLKLAGFLEALPGAKILGYTVDSPGGNLLEGERLAGMIHDQNAAIGVGHGAMCASACFLLFAAARQRIVTPDALIGVHSASNALGEEDNLTLALTTEFARDVAAYQVPAQIVGELVTTKPGQITWLSVDELKSMGATFLRPSPPGMPSQEPVTSNASAQPEQETAASAATSGISSPANTTTASIAPTSPGFSAGLADRRTWETWFSSQAGAARDGAAFWASQRSLSRPQPCGEAAQSQIPGWLAGCEQAAALIAPFDVRRRSDPQYRQGWNSL